MTVPHLTHPGFKFEPVKYGFFTREGGVSTGAFTSLNCGLASGDALENVHENHRRIAATFDLEPSNLLFCKQSFSEKVQTVAEPWARDAAPEADAMVTKLKGVGLAITAADCAPILFYDTANQIIGATHCGWKGAIKGVIQQTLVSITLMGGSAATTHACIGPCIQQSSYEVRDNVHRKFTKLDPDNAMFFKEDLKPYHYLFNLPGYIERELKKLKLASVSMLERDTVSDEAHFFSYRRKTLRNELQNGVQMSVITLGN